MAKSRARKQGEPKLVLHAQPYAYGRGGWYFHSADEFDEKFKSHRPVEEYEIEFIDGSRFELDLFKAMEVSQATVHAYFEHLDKIQGMSEAELAALFYALTVLRVSDIDDALEKAEQDVIVYEGTAQQHVEEMVEDAGGPIAAFGKDAVEQYFDAEAYARDLELNGDVSEFEYGGKTWTIPRT